MLEKGLKYAGKLSSSAEEALCSATALIAFVKMLEVELHVVRHPHRIFLRSAACMGSFQVQQQICLTLAGALARVLSLSVSVAEAIPLLC